MATMNRARLLLIRSGIIFLTFFGVAFLWLVSDVILSESLFVKALLGAWSVALFFFFWDFSMQLGEPGGLLNRAPQDDESLSSDDDKVLDSVAAELEAERRDEELWAKLLTTADGAEARRQAIDIRLRAKRLQRKTEAERLKAEQRRSDAEGTRRARKGSGATMGSVRQITRA